MTVRTTRTTISFSQPFELRDLDDIQPAGDYLLDTDEELIEGLSRLAYRRVATLLHLPSTSRPQGRTEVLSVSPAELDAALEKDRIQQSLVGGEPPRTLCLAIRQDKLMTGHVYSVGQQVSFGGRVVTYLKRTGVFTITKLLPPLGAELQYRIKSADEVHERVASEHELQVAELEKPIVAAGSRLSSADVDAARIFAGLIPLATEPPVGPQGRSAVIML